MLTGQNGILKRASEVKEKTDQSSDLEFLQIKANEALTKYYLSTNTEPENEYILKRLNEESDISADEITGTVMYNGRTYDVSDILGNTNEQTNIASQNIKLKQITKCTATEERDILLLENGKIRMIIQEENNNALRAVIPKGFYYVTGAPSTGVVISDKFGDDDNNSKGGNQFVWVPCEGKTAGNYEKTRDKDNKYGIAANWSQYNNYSNSYNNEGYFFRAMYNYDAKYFGSVSYRRDASSRFAKEHRWGNFWSVGGAWLISKEAFFNAPWVNSLKLKASVRVMTISVIICMPILTKW